MAGAWSCLTCTYILTGSNNHKQITCISGWINGVTVYTEYIILLQRQKIKRKHNAQHFDIKITTCFLFEHELLEPGKKDKTPLANAIFTVSSIKSDGDTLSLSVHYKSAVKIIITPVCSATSGENDLHIWFVSHWKLVTNRSPHSLGHLHSLPMATLSLIDTLSLTQSTPFVNNTPSLPPLLTGGVVALWISPRAVCETAHPWLHDDLPAVWNPRSTLDDVWRSTQMVRWPP